MAGALCVLLLFLCPAVMAGCGTKVVLTTGFNKDEVFRLSDRSCYLPEIMVYLTDIQNQYESVYGSGIWSASLSGVSLEENVKDTVLAKIAQVKTMYLIAQEKQIVLTPEEEKLAGKCAEEYYSLLSDEEIAYLGVNEEMLKEMYCEYALADINYSLSQIHFPDGYESVAKARRRLAFDEIFMFVLSFNDRQTVFL